MAVLPAWAQEDDPLPPDIIGPVGDEIIADSTAEPTPSEIPTPLPTTVIDPSPTPSPPATPTLTLTVSSTPSRTVGPARTPTSGISQDRYNCRDFSSQA